MQQSIKDFSMDFFSLKGKAAIVTGGNTNLGMAYCVAYAKAGADIFVPHFTEDVSEVKEAVEAEGRRIEFLRGDLTNAADRKAVVEKCLAVFGRIDILVNNANVGFFAPFEEYPDDYFQRTVEIGLNAVYYLGREVGLVMKKQGGGKIINIGSVLSFTADQGCPGYVVVKHGIIGITRDFANELGKYGVQCNALCPGFFKSDVNTGIPQEIVDRVSAQLPGGKWGEFGELMGTAVFLASRASDYVNGWAIGVDGGFSAVI
ncbi:MAG: SDR family oxidoreductase [Clostridiales Family XIII bacterium]|jgi:2-deoxy-D-gluconate 3-dehydrogenase|nr:SDR family oxidoreductase [Clostridiales Family XIII bacterium]